MTSFFKSPHRYQIEEPDAQSFTIHNNSSSPILVLYKSEDLREEGKILLEGILSAIKYSFKNVCLIEVLQVKSFSFRLLKGYSTIQHIFSFGFDSKELKLHDNLKFYQMYHFENFDIIFSDSLNELSKNNHKKKELWLQLKKNFLKS